MLLPGAVIAGRNGTAARCLKLVSTQLRRTTVMIMCCLWRTTLLLMNLACLLTRLRRTQYRYCSRDITGSLM